MNLRLVLRSLRHARTWLLTATACGMLSTMASCSDEESYTTSPSTLLTFSTDTVNLDTVFSNIPTAHKTFWVYNTSDRGLRLRSVRLSRGAASGFRVNVDGTPLAAAADYAATGMEVRHGDSLRVFVELTASATGRNEPVLDEDELVFTLESGAEQRVSLRAMAWDALLLRHLRVSRDTTISHADKPIIIMGGITVDTAATLRIAAGTTLYFDQRAGIDVYGTLRCEGTPEQPVTLRGNRLDRMFDYLPYDRVPGQWQGIRLHGSSRASELTATDLHGAYHGIRVDSTSTDHTALTLSQTALHNCQGYGLLIEQAQVRVTDSQITNSLLDCVMMRGGKLDVTGSTLAQFYPFDANRGYALHFVNERPIERLRIANSLITGYADDLLSGERRDSTRAFDYHVAHSIVRTPRITTADSLHFDHVTYEDVRDTTAYGEAHFVNIDADRQDYDFHLVGTSPAIDAADPQTSTPHDHDGTPRAPRPDIGAYEYRAATDARP